MENENVDKEAAVSPSVPLNRSPARYEETPFSSLEVGAIFYFRSSEFIKINGDEAEKVEHDSYSYANFDTVRVHR